MLSTTSEYALRAMVELAQLPPGANALARDLARQADVPVNYLSKILLTLRLAGLVHAARGTAGGYRLGKPADQIRLAEIIEQFESVSPQPRCLLNHQHQCSDATACPAHPLLRDAQLATSGVLWNTRLAALAKGGKPQVKSAAPVPVEA